MEQEEKIGGEAGEGHHDAVLQEDQVEIKGAPCGETLRAGVSILDYGTDEIL